MSALSFPVGGGFGGSWIGVSVRIDGDGSGEVAGVPSEEHAARAGDRGEARPGQALGRTAHQPHEGRRRGATSSDEADRGGRDERRRAVDDDVEDQQRRCRSRSSASAGEHAA